MKPIELELWKPKDDDPRYAERAGQRTGKEVFKELKQRLDSMGMLPDEYFLLNMDWEDGKHIPYESDIFVTTDYGGSEGIYLDGYLKWYEGDKPVTKKFFTGKTLGESGADLDRMFLISSAITKAFHGDGGQYERFVRLGGPEKGHDMVINLTPTEQRVFIDALLRQREQALGTVDDSEKLLRRMTGSITQYMNTVGERPLHISDHDKASLAIRDGELTALKEMLPNCTDTLDVLLIEAAGRAGTVGRKMTIEVIAAASQISESAYMQASKNAVEIGDMERVKFLMEQAMDRIEQFQPTYHGEILQYAIRKDRQQAAALVNWCPSKWIESAAPDLLYYVAVQSTENYYLLDTLVSKGAPCGDRARDILAYLISGEDTWILPTLLQNGLKIESDDFGAFNVCVQHEAIHCAKVLLDRGFNFEGYLAWTAARTDDRPNESIVAELSEYWQSLNQQEQDAAPEECSENTSHMQEMGGMS